MPAPDQEIVLRVLTDFIVLGRNVGLVKLVKPLEEFRSAFEATKPTFKVLQGPLHDAYSAAFTEIRERVYDRMKDRPQLGLKKEAEEFFRCSKAVSDAIFPPDDSETEVVGLAGNKESTTVLGDPQHAKEIAVQSLDVVQRFSKAVFKKDIGAAYELCGKQQRGRSVFFWVTEEPEGYRIAKLNQHLQ